MADDEHTDAPDAQELPDAGPDADAGGPDESAPNESASGDDEGGPPEADESAPGDNGSGANGSGDNGSGDNGSGANGSGDGGGDPAAYPQVRPDEQRLAGWGCVALLALGAALFWYMIHLGRQQVLELDQAGILDGGVYLSPSELDAALQRREAARRALSPQWVESYEDAVDQAVVNGMPLMVFFESEASEASRRMHTSTFANSDVRAVLREFVAVRVDTSDPSGPGAALAARFEVEAPAIVYLDSDERPLRPPSRGVVDADALEVFLRESLGNLEDGRSTADDWEVRRDEDADDEEGAAPSAAEEGAAPSADDEAEPTDPAEPSPR